MHTELRYTTCSECVCPDLHLPVVLQSLKPQPELPDVRPNRSCPSTLLPRLAPDAPPLPAPSLLHSLSDPEGSRAHAARSSDPSGAISRQAPPREVQDDARPPEHLPTRDPAGLPQDGAPPVQEASGHQPAEDQSAALHPGDLPRADVDGPRLTGDLAVGGDREAHSPPGYPQRKQVDRLLPEKTSSVRKLYGAKLQRQDSVKAVCRFEDFEPRTSLGAVRMMLRREPNEQGTGRSWEIKAFGNGCAAQAQVLGAAGQGEHGALRDAQREDERLADGPNDGEDHVWGDQL